MRLGKKRQEIRKLVRQAKERSRATALPLPTDTPMRGIPVEDPEKDSPTVIEVEPDSSPSAREPSQSATEQALQAINPSVDRNSETEGALDSVLLPKPPPRIVFKCPCGMQLIATAEVYDRRIHCGKCMTLLLLNLVFNPNRRAYGIEPFRIEEKP